MIAKNYIRYPEALRFQVEMFSNGYKNSPRIMRLMTVIFKQIADVPAWVKAAAAAAKRLVKMWKAAQIGLNFKAPAHVYQCPNGFLPSLQAKPFSQNVMTCQGAYRTFCRNEGRNYAKALAYGYGFERNA